MSTLHIRDFPDDLYERLRETAYSSGRSVGATVIDLLSAQLLEERSVLSSGPTLADDIRADRDR